MCFSYDCNQLAHVAAFKARKPHRCSACRIAIPAGAAYERGAGRTREGFWEYKLCRRCCYDRTRVVQHEQAEGCSWQESWPAVDDLIEHLEESGLGQTAPGDLPEWFQVGDMPEACRQAIEEVQSPNLGTESGDLP